MATTVTSKEVLALLREQLREWPLAGNNYYALGKVRVKELNFGTFVISVQFNPARIVSSSAKVDTQSIKERKCFLCPQNLPEVQRGIPFGEEYQILVNPFPIFPRHLTIPVVKHEPQRILPRFGDMLELAQALDEFVVFYNGPKCGASAPDHAHFQAGNKGFMPIEYEWRKMDKELICAQQGLNLYVMKEYLRNALIIESDSKEKAVDIFRSIYPLLELGQDDTEPMMNILAWYEGGTWIVAIFLREKHRPACYTAQGDENILLSPASVDMGGVFITPLEKDFEKITSEDVRTILQEVCLSDSRMNELIKKLTESV